MSKHIAVLKGGISSERDVSLSSGSEVAKALRERNYRVTEIDVTGDLPALIAALTPAPDAVFNALHGRYGEDGCIQGVLEYLRIPYTHSGVVASAVAMDKPLSKILFTAAGLRCPGGSVHKIGDVLAGDVLPRPYVVKPAREGSSVGVHIVKQGVNLPPIDSDAWRFGDEVLVEPYIPGRELTVAVMGDRPLAVTELRPHDGFYDYTNKYTSGKTDHVIPAQVPPAIYDEALASALTAHRALGCRGVSRADFRYDDTQGATGELYLLEINTQPGMTPLSLVPEQAAYCGLSFADIVSWLVEEARCDS